MTIVSRLELDHPALGTAGGAGLHTSIEALYVKLGNNMGSRLFYVENLANAATSDLDHNFGTDIANLRYDIYLWDTGTQVLTRVTPQTSPALSAFPVIERVGFEDTQFRITNSSGAERDLVVCVFNDVISTQEGDIADIDTTTIAPEDGQALVFDFSTKKFRPGASGDASFKISGVTDPSAGIKGGTLILADGRELQTYDGTGGASTDYGTDLSINLDTVLGSNPANATGYYLYIDLNTLGAAVVLSDTLRTVYGVVQANFALLTTTPAQVDRDRYIEIGFIKSATSGTVWSGTGSSFSTTAVRQGVRSTPDMLPENFSVNPLFERSITQGVTATTVTAAAETSSPLVGKQSLKLTSQASTGTVQLAIKAIPAGYLGKLPLHYSAMMLTDASDANGDWTVGIYNTTDSTYTVAATNLTGAGTMNAVAMSWVPQSGKTYEARIARTISTASRVLLVDKQRVSNDPLPLSPMMGPYESFTPSYNNLGGATTLFNTGYCYRDGEFLVGTLYTRFSAAGVGGAIVQWNLPTYRGETIVPKVSASLQPLGHASYSGAGDPTTMIQGIMTAGSGIIPLQRDGNGTVNNTSLAGSLFQWTWHFKIPIASWAATGVTVTPSQVPRSTNVVDNSVLGFAQTGGGTTRAVDLAYGQAHVDGRGQYFVDLYLRTGNTAGTDTGTQYVSSTMTATGANSSDFQPMRFVTTGTSAQESFVAYVSNQGGLRLHSEGSSSAYAECSWAGRVYLASKPSWFDANLIAGSGSLAIQEATATELGLIKRDFAKVIAEGTTLTVNNNVINFPEIIDTRSLYVNGVFTADRTMMVLVSAQLHIGTPNSGNELQVRKNGTRLARVVAALSPVSINYPVSLVAGDTVDTYFSRAGGDTTTAAGSDDLCWLSIVELM